MIIMIITEWWNELTMIAKVFWGISIISSVFFIILFVFSLFGFGTDTDADMSFDGGSGDFPFFSAKAIVAFFTFFGWTGILMINQDKALFSVLFASLISGLLAMFLVSYLFKIFNRLTETGNFDPLEMTFQTGHVYLRIPGKQIGKGKIHITINNKLIEVDAVTDGPEIPFGFEVKVIEVVQPDLVLVELNEPFNI